MDLQPPDTAPGAPSRDDHTLRRRAAARLIERADVIVADTVAVFPFTGPRRLEAEYCTRLGALVVRLLSETVLAASLDYRASGISELMDTAAERDLAPDQLFTFIDLALNTSLDEVSTDPLIGATTEPWPQAAQTLRRAGVDLLAAWTARALATPSEQAIVDPLTTLHTRPVLDAVLAKECYRAERFEHWLSLIVLDVDNLSDINRIHGFGVGDRILERLGILLRTYFRQHDWVVRYHEDAIAVLLPETSPPDALALAERTRTMVAERLTFRDYRTEERAEVTVSVAVVSARALEGEPIDEVRLLRAAEAAVVRAKLGGRNCVEQVELPPRLMSVEEASVVLNTDIAGIERLVGDGRLEPITAGRHVRLERERVEALARDRSTT
ncbi:MAG: diguanylate cyclase [Vicinamibacterales bacterium]